MTDIVSTLLPCLSLPVNFPNCLSSLLSICLLVDLHVPGVELSEGFAFLNISMKCWQMWRSSSKPQIKPRRCGNTSNPRATEAGGSYVSWRPAWPTWLAQPMLWDPVSKHKTSCAVYFSLPLRLNPRGQLKSRLPLQYYHQTTTRQGHSSHSGCVKALGIHHALRAVR